jgi:hypothetical protein
MLLTTISKIDATEHSLPTTSTVFETSAFIGVYLRLRLKFSA